jgi:tetratricopeptide (TPR) repeat protein
MMSAAAAASELNNQGVQLMTEHGDYRQAISAFTRGVSIIRQELSRQYKEQQRCKQQDCSCSTDSEESARLLREEDDDDFIPSCPFHKLATDSSSPLTSSSEKRDETTADDQLEPFIMKNPIFIPTTNYCSCYKHCVKLSFIQLYNLALANHLLALDGKQVPDKKRLQTARGLYELAYTLQLTEMDIQPTLLQVMVIVNNLGQVHTALDNHDKARECFENLLSTLLFYVDCGGNNDENHQDHREQLDGFLSNVLPLIFANGSQPASAA